MEINTLMPRKALNKAYLKVKPGRSQIDAFKTNLHALLAQVRPEESEEFNKNLLSRFLRDTWYHPDFFINTKGRNDLVIHNGKDNQASVGVIIEAKKPTNKSEMLQPNRLNVKAMQELVLYYLRERITNNNLEVKHLIATNISEWFIFDARDFEKHFARNKTLVRQFHDFNNGRLADTSTAFFYKEIAAPAIEAVEEELTATWFDLGSYQKAMGEDPPREEEKRLVALYKVLSPEHLLKLPFVNDSNQLDKGFYNELLHIIGLRQVAKKGKKLIERKAEGERDAGSLLENTIMQLDTLDKVNRMEDAANYGEQYRDRLFNIGLELCITWINRVLFLKLLEAQLLRYHKGDPAFAFMNRQKIKTFGDLNRLFFSVLARKPADRNDYVKQDFASIPYLNSSLFEVSEIEDKTLLINNLNTELKIPLAPATVLKDASGKRIKGEKKTLDYLFAFLDAYDFSNEGSEDIQESNKTLINASVLGLIFEKINGYKEGSFFTPGFITMYMCRETIRRAVVEKFLTPRPPLHAGEGEDAKEPRPSPHAGEGEDANAPRPSPHAGEGEDANAPRPSLHAGEGEDANAHRSSLHSGEGEDAKVPRSSPHAGEGEDAKFPRTVETGLPPKLLAFARELRKNQTEAEEILWQLLRNRKLGGLKFRRQHPISKGFILDFYCAEARLAVELDGGYHLEEQQRERDEARTHELKKYGIKVIRFLNHEVENSIEKVLARILAEAVLTPRPPLHAGEGEDAKVPRPSLHAGEGEDAKVPRPSLHAGEGEDAEVSRFSPYAGEGEDAKVSRASVYSGEGAGGEEKTLTDVYNLIGTRYSMQEANDMINSLKICDPAVGSGHFLVSALNEILAIKSELGILCDRQGRRLRDYHLEVENDELVITDEEGRLFEYRPGSKESQRVQETLFHEKQTLIENCLFGVDINPNSVKICRLRLWIELLKNAYYKADGELETLPNIDINIKCGNSLVSRFALDADLKKALKSSKWSIEDYRVAVQSYRSAQSGEEKRAMKRLISDIKSGFRTEISKNDPKVLRLNKLKGELYSLTTQTQLFELSKKEQAAWNKKLDKLTHDITKLEKEIEAIQSNKIYRNAFEWRFEFPEVLNDDGEFTGFDVVIGNPPYIRQEELGVFKNYLSNNYKVFISGGDIFSYFYELSHEILRKKGFFSFINNTFDKTSAGKTLREFVINNFRFERYVDFTDVVVFEEATTYPIILIAQKSNQKSNFKFYKYTKASYYDKELLNNEAVFTGVAQDKLNSSAWNFINSFEQNIFAKIQRHKTVGEKYGKCFRGIITGLNEAFVTEKSLGNYNVLKDVYDGKDIKKWLTPSPFKKMIVFENKSTSKHFGQLSENVALEKMKETYPEIFYHLEPFKEKAIKRYDKGEFWWELRNCAYYAFFEKPKIIFPNLQKSNKFAFDENGIYLNAPAVFLPTNDKALLAILNSKVVWYFLKSICVIRSGGYIEVKPQYFEQIPIPDRDEKTKIALTELAKQVITKRKENELADISELELEIDRLVYELYGLTEEEIRIVEGG